MHCVECFSIARAIATCPSLIVCDEPTSSLGASVQAQVRNPLRDLRDATGAILPFIGHGLAVAR
jgi:ABC-type oligopeptide transport system ATPase subunit